MYQRYQVTFYQAAVSIEPERYSNLADALAAAREFISDIRQTCTSKRGFQKIGDLNRDRCQRVQSWRGTEAAVSINPIRY